MTPPWAYLNRQDYETFRVLVVFLANRLAEQGTIDWALKLKPDQRIERIALEEVLTGPRASDVGEPWATAWHLIEESWLGTSSDDYGSTGVYSIQKRLRAGDRSGATIAAVVNLVEPRLKVEPIGDWRWSLIKKPHTPKTIEHVLSARLTSGDLIELSALDLVTLTDSAFLAALANALEAAVNRGLDIARRLGWKDTQSLLGLGMLSRVYYTQVSRTGRQDEEPDAYHRGIAPSVKLLHAMVAHIAIIEPNGAQPFVLRWQTQSSSVFVRLWAAMARSNQLVAADTVASFLTSLDDRHFWDLHNFPEIAELRAVRFGELDPLSQEQVATRLRIGPPRSYWPKQTAKEKIAEARQYWAARELQRIQVAGAVLPANTKKWLDSRIVHFDDLGEMTITSGFAEGGRSTLIPPNPDNRYDELQGLVRLQALNTALATSRGGWRDDPAERANDWINQQSNPSRLLADFAATENGGDDFPLVWDRFGWAHRPYSLDARGAEDEGLIAEAGQVLAQMSKLSDATIQLAVEGVSAWLDSWKTQIVGLPLFLPFWLRIWPIAVEATNSRPEDHGDEELTVTANSREDDRDQHASLALNTPAGRLTGVFLEAWRSYEGQQPLFSKGSPLREMRDALVEASGRSGLLVRYRLIEFLPYFLRADSEWTQKYLIVPLHNDDGAALALWRAVARRTHFTEVLEIIGASMVERANDRRLGRETRRGLVFSLVIETLHAFREDRQPAIPNSLIQQMLRNLDDEVRASAANVVEQFVRELSSKSAGDRPQEGALSSAALLFRSSGAPFLQKVWPQERSLATPGVSGALADLPATSGEAFSEAVDTIERFLVPFECWSMVNYGLYGDDGTKRKLAIIDDEPKAQALLRLLDSTVGLAEGAVVPQDLTDALEQVRSVAPALTESAAFRRLSTAARR